MTDDKRLSPWTKNAQSLSFRSWLTFFALEARGKGERVPTAEKKLPGEKVRHLPFYKIKIRSTFSPPFLIYFFCFFCGKCISLLANPFLDMARKSRGRWGLRRDVVIVHPALYLVPSKPATQAHKKITSQKFAVTYGPLPTTSTIFPLCPPPPPPPCPIDSFPLRTWERRRKIGMHRKNSESASFREQKKVYFRGKGGMLLHFRAQWVCAIESSCGRKKE